MNKRVVCMVRGGEAGRRVQRQAIAYAQKTGLPLFFLHVIYLRGLSLKDEALMASARKEMTWLARVTLNLARSRARTAGLQTDFAIRHGPIIETTIAFLNESPVDQLFIGSPSSESPDFQENLLRVREFAGQISDATGVQVTIADEG
ncbi:MAG: hypothetical protein A2Z16_07860 [Chloroflexi bacterium RBG_16_54_18]|nr:MAG: hypothetical protein A2Z16_07860 [Chloroflexi bacterium RBG_16_54_18]